MIGRSEHVNLAAGTARSISCGSCLCATSYSNGVMSPGSFLGAPGGPAFSLLPQEHQVDCNGVITGPYTVSPTPSSWSSSASAVASVASNGYETRLSGGTTAIGAAYPGIINYQNGQFSCAQATTGGSSSAPMTVTPPCPRTVAVDQITQGALTNGDYPTYKTGVGVLVRMKAEPTGTDYTGAVLLETVTPTTNSCPANIALYTSFPTITAANKSTFTVGSSAAWEGGNFPSILNDFYDSHRTLVSIDVLGTSRTVRG
jgi:hypothetical protein